MRKTIQVRGVTAARATEIRAAGRREITICEALVRDLIDAGVVRPTWVGQIQAELERDSRTGQPIAITFAYSSLPVHGITSTAGSARHRVTEEELLAGSGPGWDWIVARARDVGADLVPA